ncbi:MAG: NAD(P)H-hydrate dehydratase [Chloroflexi bacterium]|nr:NAD(P)H-hydrate dehydratase [Chloroflexota bacterium]
MRLVTTAEMRELEQRTFAAGVSEADLMERAGTAVAHAAADWLVNPRGRSLLVLVGKGNNGGDALIAARVLAQRYEMRPRIYLCAERAAGDPLLTWAHELGVPTALHGANGGESEAALREWLADAGVVLDGILGIGGRLPLRGAIAEVLAHCRQIRPPGQRRIAVDVPTGVQSDTGQADERAFEADLTLATGPAKPGLFIYPGAGCAGRVRALDIGLTGAGEAGTLFRLEASDAARLLPARPDDSHKGTFGTVLVVAGSNRYVGAAYLTGAAAVRAGAGLVTLALPRHAQLALAGRSVETTFLPLPDDPAVPGCLTPRHLGLLLETALGYDAVALGPGLGSEDATVDLVRLLLERLAADEGAPSVLVDADGLNAIAKSGDWPRPAAPKWVLTPHPGEMSRLTGVPVRDVQADRLGIARESARRWGQILVLKGAPSIVAAPGGTAHLSAFANAALATAGSGDVLSGIIGGLLAQRCPPHEAALAGVYVHGLAGELWRSAHGAAGLAVSQLAELIPHAERHVRALS